VSWESGLAIASISIETKTIQKMRLRILPFVFLLFVIALLDRLNIGFAALTMNRELAITSQQYGLLFGIFFFGYFLFEIPSNLLLHKIGARIWIARILLTWGAVAALTGFVRTVHQLYAVRFLLGFAEAGYFPGIMLYLTYGFPRREQAQAFALLLTANPVTNILGAPLSGLILDHVHWFGVSSWRWLSRCERIKSFHETVCLVAPPSDPIDDGLDLVGMDFFTAECLSGLQRLAQSLFQLPAIGSADSRSRPVLQDRFKFSMGDRLQP